jgi:hypothetical protein
LLTERGLRRARRNRKTLKQRREQPKLLAREGLLAQEVLIPDVQTTLRQLSLNLAGCLLRLKALKVESLLLAPKVPQKLCARQLLSSGVKVQTKTSLIKLFLSLPSSLFLLLGIEPKLCRTLTRLLSGLEALNLKLAKATGNIRAHAKGALPELLCGLLEALLRRPALKTKLRRLKLSGTVCLEGLLGLIERLLAAARLNVAKLLTEVPFALCLHDGLTVSTERALRGCLLTNLAAHDVGLATSLPRLDVRHELLVRVHVALERGLVCKGPGVKAGAKVGRGVIAGAVLTTAYLALQGADAREVRSPSLIAGVERACLVAGRVASRRRSLRG